MSGIVGTPIFLDRVPDEKNPIPGFSRSYDGEGTVVKRLVARINRT